MRAAPSRPRWTRQGPTRRLPHPKGGAQRQMAWALFFEAKRREEAGHRPAGTKLRQRHCGLKATASAMVHRSRGRWAAGLLPFKETPAQRRTNPVWRQANGAEINEALGIEAVTAPSSRETAHGLPSARSGHRRGWVRGPEEQRRALREVHVTPTTRPTRTLAGAWTAPDDRSRLTRNPRRTCCAPVQTSGPRRSDEDGAKLLGRLT